MTISLFLHSAVWFVAKTDGLVPAASAECAKWNVEGSDQLTPPMSKKVLSTESPYLHPSAEDQMIEIASIAACLFLENLSNLRLEFHCHLSATELASKHDSLGLLFLR